MGLLDDMRKGAAESMSDTPEEEAAKAAAALKVQEDAAKVAELEKTKAAELAAQENNKTEDPNGGEKPKPELNDDLVKKYLSEKLGSDIEDLSTFGKKEELTFASPEAESFNTFVSETNGRGIQDYLKSQKDWSQVDEVSLAREKYLLENPGMTNEDFSDLNDLDLQPLEGEEYTQAEKDAQQRLIKKRDIRIKQQATQAKDYFSKLSEKIKAPLERSKPDNSALDMAKDVWKQNVKGAVEGFDLGIDGYQNEETSESLNEKYSSVENILGSFKDDSGKLDVGNLMKTIERGRKFDKIKDHMLKQHEATVTARIMAELENSGDANLKNLGDRGEAPDDVAQLGKMLDSAMHNLRK